MQSLNKPKERTVSFQKYSELFVLKHKESRMKSFILLGIAIALISSAIFGQTAAGSLAGVVSGPDGVLPGASVVVTDNQTKLERTIITNGSGGFELPQLSVGSYTVKVTAAGFK